MEHEGTVEDRVIAVLKRFSARQQIDPDQLVGRDVGINGSDGVELLDELEELFGVNLEPLMQEETRYLPPRWIDRLRRREHGPSHTDLTVRRLVEFIKAHKARR